MSLIVTYPPRDDESGMGYYRRLSADNALFNWRSLTATAGVDRNRRALLTHTDDVARNLGLEHSWAESAKRKDEQSRNWGRLHRAHSDAVCPACIAESPYLRQHWEHAFVTSCPKHHLQLVDQCGACGKSLAPERIYIGLCPCGHELRNLPRMEAAPAQQWLSLLIASNGRESGGIQPDLNDVDVNILVKVARTLCLYSDPTQPGASRRTAIPKSVAGALDFLAPLGTLLDNWPNNFRTHVEQRIAVGRKDARTLNTLLGDWYISLRKLCQDTALEPLLKVIIDVAAEKSDCVLGRDSAKVMAEDTTGYQRTSDAAKAIGISVSRLHDAVHSGECENRTRRMGTRGQVYEIPCAEISRIQQQRARWISDIAACELAGVTPVVLERMKAAGVIRSDARWREDIMKGGPVEYQSVLDLYERVVRYVEPPPLRPMIRHFAGRN